MKVLAFNVGHDGSVAFVEDGEVRFNLENEKDNHPRNGALTPSRLLQALELTELPDVIAISGLGNEKRSDPASTESSYRGIGSDAKLFRESRIAGRQVVRFSSSHERSHVMCGYGLSPFPQGEPCYMLIWEGTLGAFYYIDREMGIHKIGDVLPHTGGRYAFLYALADPNFSASSALPRLGDAGKLMALVSYGRSERVDSETRQLVSQMLDTPNPYAPPFKRQFEKSRYCNIGVETQDFKDLAKYFSDAVFDRFHEFARKNLSEKLPLIIVGGCGLNCEWNSRWKASGLFTEVFVPPCANDSGVAIGAAIDALHHYTGVAKVRWNVYCGDYFIEDATECAGFERRDLVLGEVCERLLGGQVIAWVQGRYEMGPRALGNRSLLAAPFSVTMRNRLNSIKRRENFRPIAPICREEDLGEYLDDPAPSPHMLYFQHVKSPDLRAITHVDGSTRVQSVTKSQNPRMHALLSEFRARSKFGILCNTSLNFPGHGFINRLSDLVAYANERKLDGFVVEDSFWTRKT